MRSKLTLQKNYLFWGATFLGLVLDRVTKLWVVTEFSLQESSEVIPNVFHFTYVTNPGAAWGILDGFIGLRWISLVVSLGLVYLGLFFKDLNRWDQCGFGFLLSGAAGNGIDRFVSGHVVDFLHFKLINFPVFNVADVFINVGLACLFVGILKQPSAPKKNRSQ